MTKHKEKPKTKLKEIRKRKNILQPDLAERAGVSLKALQAYEQDFRPLGRASAEDVYRIAKALGTTMEELLGLEKLVDRSKDGYSVDLCIIDELHGAPRFYFQDEQGNRRALTDAEVREHLTEYQIKEAIEAKRNDPNEEVSYMTVGGYIVLDI